MSASALPAACLACRRRGWLLAELGGPLDFLAHDRPRLRETLALTDSDLLRALAGRRRAELTERYEQFAASSTAGVESAQTRCRHTTAYPPMLRTLTEAPMLHATGDLQPLDSLLGAPAVAIIGTSRASDYGMQMAASLARGLSASGVSVIASLKDGIAAAVHEAALASDGRSIAVLSDGLAVTPRATIRALHRRLLSACCLLSELPPDCRGRRWGAPASERIVVAIASVVVVVEADDSPEDLAAGTMALALERPLAAIPGRLTSPCSRGTHALLMRGASLVRDTHDVLELLDRPEHRDQAAVETEPPSPMLDGRLRTVLDAVGAGRDTPEKLRQAGAQLTDLTLALSELELMGLLTRGDGGRYLPRDPSRPNRHQQPTVAGSRQSASASVAGAEAAT